jgi:anti-sigma B factor antagonist
VDQGVDQGVDQIEPGTGATMSADAAPIDAHIERLDGEVHVSLRGEIDLVTAPALTALLDEVVDERPSRVVVDMAEVGFLDSSGLSALVHARNRLHDQDGRLAVRAPSPALRKLLALTHLYDIIEIC